MPRPLPRKLTTVDFLSLLELDDDQLLATLNDRSFSFDLYLEGRTYGPAEVDLILHALARICEIRGFLARKTRLLRIVKKHDAFLFNDVPKIIQESLHRKHDFNLVSFVSYYMIILRNMLIHLTHSKVVENFPQLQNYINRMTEYKMKNMQIALKHFEMLKIEKEKYEEPSSDEDGDEVENFRDLSIVPSGDDVRNYESTKIPINITDGEYKSVGHYLGVHFRLMREDMLRSFRNCIKSQLANPQSSYIDPRKNSGHVYDDVTVKIPPNYTCDGICYDVKVVCNSPVDWVKSKRLIPGNLICLTKDNFESVVFATVKEQRLSRDVCRECKLIICIEVSKDRKVQKFKMLTDSDRYIIIGTDAYFESYRYLLAAIKSMSEGNFPLADMITYFDFYSLHPEYLDDNKIFCLHEHKACHDATRKENDPHPCKTFNVLDYNEWPTMEALGLDDQQLHAFQTALTKKVAIIQGPPGTGKTFIGVKIVKALLENVKHKPILISCMTNHALDQFLAFIVKHTRKVVRLGGQCSNKALESYKISSLIDAIAIYRSEKDNCFQMLNNTQRKSLGISKSISNNILEQTPQMIGDFSIIEELNSVCRDLNSELKKLYLCENNYEDSDALNEILDDHIKKQLREGSSSSTSALTNAMFEWLDVSRKSELHEKCKKYWQENRLCKMQDPEQCDSKQNKRVKDIWKVTNFQERYALFYTWREKCLGIIREHIKDKKMEYGKLIRRYEKPISSDRIDLLQGADVIGVTTTGASKYRQLIRLAQPTIVIVEEAAQVLESHIISCLVPGVKHLILIGDHKQLRPLPFDNELATRHKLNISMFERLFNNRAPSATLASQHRMKPCMAELLALNIYPSLCSDKSVEKYEEIRGVKHSMFFFNHSELEDSGSTGTSSSNVFEAEFVAALAKYFISQNYSQSQITIIATYAAQVPLIHKHLDSELNDIHVTTVDNYQGEENDIILVSFVRSNSSVIGFLKETNRVCVALSRAKKGMFCIGNFNLYKDKTSDWADIIDHLSGNVMIGKELPLECYKHKSAHNVKSHDDILDFISEGCKQMCNFPLPCGHICEKTCHFNDIDHLQYLCGKPCEKYIDETTICPRKCFQPCKKKKKKAVLLPCGHYSVFYKNNVNNAYLCQDEVQQSLPCGHEVTLPCHVDVKSYECRALEPVILECGHKKLVNCFKKNNIADEICHEHKPILSPCGHYVQVPCMMKDIPENDLLVFCTASCNKQLYCCHPCVGSCLWCFDTQIHSKCSVKCKTRLACGHICEGFCGSPCPPCGNQCDIACPHDVVCINRCLRACVECTKPCARRCDHIECTNTCSQNCSVKPCNVQCDKKLECGHSCIGLCGDPCPYLCRVCHAEDLDSEKKENDRYVMLEDCEHIIEVNRMDECIKLQLECFEWPFCPLEDCKEIIRKSLRYKDEIKIAKDFCLRSIDTDDEVQNVYFVLHNMFGLDYEPPAIFQDVNREMIRIMEHDKPSIASLTVLKNCALSLKKLVDVYTKLGEENLEGQLRRRFDSLLLWICNHLKEASFQQMIELESAVDNLENCN